MSTTTDLVCGIKVDSESEQSLEYAGKCYYFCSQRCVEKFSADPDKYIHPVEPTPKILIPSVQGYVCPMHPEVHQATPRFVPEMWYGAGAHNCGGCQGREFGAGRYDAPFLDQHYIGRAGVRDSDGC